MKRRLTRASAAATGTLLVLGLVACGSDSSDPDDSGPGGSSDSTMSIAWAAPPNSLDPHQATNTADYSYSQLIFDRLTKISPDGNEVVPMLATAWETTSDGGAIELTLRDDVTFHDGTPFDASVVKANLERGKTLEGSSVTAALASIETIEVVDDTTVRLNLVEGGGAEIPAALASNAGEMISPKAIEDGRDLKLDPGDAGSGPYLLTELTPGTGATFERAEDYWDDFEDRPAKLEITLVQAPAVLSGVQTGQYDLGMISTAAPEYKQVKTLADAGDVNVYVKAIRGSQMMMFNSEKAPLDNLQVRQAIGYAIDREAIGNELYGGDCTPVYQPFPEGHFAFSEKVDSEYAFDLDKAKQLVAESGLDDISFGIEVAPQQQATAEAVQAQLAEAGIDAEIVPVTQDVRAPNFIAGKATATMGGLVPGSDPSGYVATNILGGMTMSRGGDPAMVERVKQLAAEALSPDMSTEDRGARYQEIQEIVIDQAWGTHVCSSGQSWIFGDDVVGVDDSWSGAWSALPDFGFLGIKG